VITLTEMAPGRDDEFAAMLDEYRAAGELDVYRGHHAIAWQGYGPFYELMSRMKKGGYPTPDIVPMDSYFIEENSRIVGELYLRHRLSPSLESVGGHIGYKVRPSCRNRGIATAALRLGLQLAGAFGIEQALITCDDSNAASARVIEKCGGVRISDARNHHGVERRYHVAIQSACKPK
jgi:predicted acetyltransferase